MDSPSLAWAHKIIADWNAGEYPAKFKTGYELACAAVGQSPQPHPSERGRYQTPYRADVDG